MNPTAAREPVARPVTTQEWPGERGIGERNLCTRLQRGKASKASSPRRGFVAGPRGRGRKAHPPSCIGPFERLRAVLVHPWFRGRRNEPSAGPSLDRRDPEPVGSLATDDLSSPRPSPQGQGRRWPWGARPRSRRRPGIRSRSSRRQLRRPWRRRRCDGGVPGVGARKSGARKRSGWRRLLKDERRRPLGSAAGARSEGGRRFRAERTGSDRRWRGLSRAPKSAFEG